MDLNPIIYFLITCVVMFGFGVGYAYRIAIKPFPPRRTWLSVVIGDGITDIGSFFLLFILTNNVWVALIPFFAHMLTGSPMILGQVLKYKFFDQENQNKLEAYNNGSNDKKQENGD